MNIKQADGRRLGAFALVVALGLTLGACLLSPGKFVSNLDIRKNGTFAFTYKGEISMLGVAQIAAMNKAKAAEVFTPTPCYTEPAAVRDTGNAARSPAADGLETVETVSSTVSSVERKCTDRELAEQKNVWDEERAMRSAKEKKDLEQMKALLGGLDPTDPKSIEEFAARLHRQAGWNAVTYRGDGLFDVDYAMTGKLDHDFIFPVIERFPTTNTFVQVLRRTDGTVRIDAPGFVLNQSSNPMMGMMGLGMMGDSAKDQAMPKMAQIDGTFALTTDGQILANNTDEGPRADQQGQKLTWAVNVRTTAGPTALIKLGN